MVFFTCNHCGEAIKKPAVEKHYNTKCRGGEVFVSCMDCLKDFRGKEFVEHTKCVSETEKYSGKDYVAKGSVNKGQRKQDSWIEIIRSILVSSEYQMKPVTRSIFERLQSYENVPRKKAKFENFVNNSFKINKNLLPDVWGILEKEMIKMKSNAAQNKPEENVTNDKDTEADENGSGNGENTAKKDKNSKTKKNSNESEEDNVINDEKKEKKKTKKRKAEETTVDETKDEIKSLTENAENPEKKKKKKKSKDVESIVAVNEEETMANSNGIEKKQNGTKAEIENTGNNSFDWHSVILKNAKEGTSTEKLKNKVLKKYKKFLSVEEFENCNKAEKTFKKYLKKSGVTVENDVVKIAIK